MVGVLAPGIGGVARLRRRSDGDACQVTRSERSTTRVASRATLGSLLKMMQLAPSTTASLRRSRTASALRSSWCAVGSSARTMAGRPDEGSGHHHPLTLANRDFGAYSYRVAVRGQARPPVPCRWYRPSVDSAVLRNRAGSPMFSATLSSSSRTRAWGTTPTVDQGGALLLVPHVIEPESGTSQPAKRLTSVVFPHREGPTTATSSALFNEKSIVGRAWIDRCPCDVPLRYADGPNDGVGTEVTGATHGWRSHTHVLINIECGPALGEQVERGVGEGAVARRRRSLHIRRRDRPIGRTGFRRR